MSHETLQLIWFLLIAVLWTGYLVLEGFDFGVGMLLPFLPRGEKERRVAINTIGGPLVLLEDTGPVGHWLEVSLQGFSAGAVVTATLPDGRTLTDELHAGSSYLSSEDPRAHFGLGSDTSVAKLTIRWPDGKTTSLANVRGDRILSVAPPKS